MPVEVIEKDFGHSDWFNPGEFSATMKRLTV
jgi:hypothetical protein